MTCEQSRPNRAYLALGSNIAPEANLPAAVRELARSGRVAAVSRVWESAPVGFADQPNFLNAAVLLETPLSAREVCLRVIPEIERRLERVRDPANKNGPRTIDIDLVLFNREILRVGRRRIPDPEIAERPFLAVPLAEIAPEYVHPDTGQTLARIASGLDTATAAMRLRPDVELGRLNGLGSGLQNSVLPDDDSPRSMPRPGTTEF